MPKDSVLVRCIHAYARYRIMIGLHCMTKDRLDRLKRYISTYKDICSVSVRFLSNVCHLFMAFVASDAGAQERLQIL